MAIPADVQHTDARSYLALERASAERHELVDGVVVGMAGASYARSAYLHSVIVANLVTALAASSERSAKPGGGCRPLSSDMRIKVETTGLYAYPDVLLVCGEPAFEDERADTLLNPIAIFEVLSPSTEAFDRGEKFAHYRRLPSLRDYVLVAQSRPRVEHYQRQSDVWVLRETEGLDGRVVLEAAGCEVALAGIYAGVAAAGGA